MGVAEFYELAVALAFFGGLLWGGVGLWALASWRGRQQPPDVPRSEPFTPKQRFHDALLILLVGAVPQCFVLSLPVIYPSGPNDVPVQLAEGAVVGLAAVFVMWGWAGLCLLRARRSGAQAWLTRRAVWALFTPTWASLLAVVACIIRGTR